MVRPFLIPVSFFAFLFVANAQAPSGSSELKVVRYDDLKKAVLSQRGKVLVVDFWEFL